MMAAMASKSKTVSFVGGMDIPLIRKFGCGYVGGAKAAGATNVIYNMTGDTPAAWNDPTKGGEITKSQIDQGADVIYAAAGGTGVGVLQAAADAGKLAGGINDLGLKEGGVDYALDENNKDLITPEMKAAAEKAKADIIAGTIEVHDYMSDNKCPY